MTVFILAPEKTLWHNRCEWDFPKVLIPLSETHIMLDWHMHIFKDLDVNIVVGYKADLIREHCKKRGYNVNFIYDSTYHKSYNAGRTLMNVSENLLSAKPPIITTYGDNVISPRLFKKFLETKADICMVDGHAALLKFSKQGIQEFFKVMKTFDLKLHNETLGMYGGKDGDTFIFSTLYKIKDNGNITVKNVFGNIWDIDEPSDRGKIWELNMIKEFLK